MTDTSSTDLEIDLCARGGGEPERNERFSDLEREDVASKSSSSRMQFAWPEVDCASTGQSQPVNSRLRLTDETMDYGTPSKQSGLQDDRHENNHGTSGGRQTSTESEGSIDVRYPSVDQSVTGQWGLRERNTGWANAVMPPYDSSNCGNGQEMFQRPEHSTGRLPGPLSSGRADDRTVAWQWKSLSESTERHSSIPEVSSSQYPDNNNKRFNTLTQMHDDQAEKVSVSDTADSASVKTQEEENNRVVKFLKQKGEQLTKSITPHWPLDGFLAKTFTRAVVVLLSYGAAWAILGDDILPCSLLFSFSLLVLLSAIGGFFARILYLPPLVGMIVVGFLFNNIPKFNSDDDHNSRNDSTNNMITNATANNMSMACGMEAETDCYALDDDWASILRSVALVIILTRAGLSLNAGVLRKMKCLVTRLAFLPSLAEASVEAVAAYLLLDMPWAWAFMTGYSGS